jgi:hypothetical protein
LPPWLSMRRWEAPMLNYCRGCGEVFGNFWALLRHEKKCEA